MEGLVKNQHYIPQCILTRFSNESQVYEVLVDSDKPPYVIKCKSSMVERFTYEHPDIERNRLEKYFSKIESYFGPAMVNLERMIDEHETGGMANILLKNYVEKYMREVIIFYYRSGALLHEFEFQRERKHDRIGLMLENIMNSPYIKGLSRTITEKYSFAVIKSDDNDFLLSDQYLTTVALGIKNRLFNISNRHMGLKNVLILMPISCKYYIAYFHGNVPEYIKTDRINLLSEGQVREINKAIINNSYIKCIGKNKQSLIDAHKSFVYKSPAKIIAGFESGATTGATLKKEVFFYEKDQKTWDFFLLHEFMDYKNIGRNEPCKCGSGLKFKKCCWDSFIGAERMMNDIVNKRSDYALVSMTDIEKGIGEF